MADFPAEIASTGPVVSGKRTSDFNGTGLPSPTILRGKQNVNAEIIFKPGAVIHFKVVGFYVTGSVYESFVTTTAPVSSSLTNPNNGHSLTQAYVSNIW
jgi:hypothetical protein